MKVPKGLWKDVEIDVYGAQSDGDFAEELLAEYDFVHADPKDHHYTAHLRCDGLGPVAVEVRLPPHFSRTMSRVSGSATHENSAISRFTLAPGQSSVISRFSDYQAGTITILLELESPVSAILPRSPSTRNVLKVSFKSIEARYEAPPQPLARSLSPRPHSPLQPQLSAPLSVQLSGNSRADRLSSGPSLAGSSPPIIYPVNNAPLLLHVASPTPSPPETSFSSTASLIRGPFESATAGSIEFRLMGSRGFANGEGDGASLERLAVVSLITAEGIPLPEFPGYGPTPVNDLVVRHVECQNGRRFKIYVARPIGFEHEINIEVTIDGRVVERVALVAEQEDLCIATFDESSPHGFVKKAFAFAAEVSLVQADLRQPSDGPSLGTRKVDLDQLGSISITFEAGSTHNTDEHTFSICEDCENKALISGAKMKKYRTAEALRTLGLKHPFDAEDTKPTVKGLKRKVDESKDVQKKVKTEIVGVKREATSPDCSPKVEPSTEDNQAERAD
ncbi:unnamed protein product [Cutaneotrichosporon oleaginosum]